jgi:hypothetical protein
MIWNYYHLKIKHWIYKELGHFQNSYLLKIDEEKNMLCTWKTMSIYYNKLQKENSKIHSYEKMFFGKKNI